MQKKFLTSLPDRSYNINTFHIWSVKNEWLPILEVLYVS